MSCFLLLVGPGLWKPDIQFPIPEKTEAVITMEPYTYYKPAMEFHTKGTMAVAGLAAAAAAPAAPAAAAAAAAQLFIATAGGTTAAG
jgi:hypothetical protein